MIINLRGTSGSGKSTVVFNLLDKLKSVKPISLDIPIDKHPHAYQLKLPNSKPLFIVGPYHVQSGGCDRLGTNNMVMRVVDQLALRGSVLFEGRMISFAYGAVGEWSKKYGDDFVFAFLDTPLTVCLERIQARRRAHGNNRPLNPFRTEEGFKNNWKVFPKLQQQGRRVVMIDHKRATKQILDLLIQ